MKTSEKRKLVSEVFSDYRELFTESGLQNIKSIAKQYKEAEM